MKAYNYSNILIAFFLVSCNLEKDIDVALPIRETSLVVECYLEPGKPYRLFLFESESFFSAPDQTPRILDAEVYIVHKGDTVVLQNNTSLDIESLKFYNYTSHETETVPNDFNTEFNLFIRDKRGRTVKGTTTILPPVAIDSIGWVYNEERTMAGPTIYFQDDNRVDNYYRYLITADSLSGDVRRDFLINDATFQTAQALITARPRSEKDVQLFLSFFNLTKDHYKFLESTEGAIRANSNPFGQASSIQSNLEGGYGIFTGLSYVRKIVVVP